MKRPSFQFYPADWRNNAKLRRCSEAARGAWVDVLCVLHDSDEYGVCRWPLADLARAACVSMKAIRELAEKDVLKGSDKGASAYVYTPRHAGQDGEPVTLIAATESPCWFSSRFVRDEYVRTKRGIGSRFDEENQPPKKAPKSPPKRGIGDGEGMRQGDGPSSSSSSSSTENTNTPLPPKGGELPLLAPHEDEPRVSENATPPKAKGPLQLRAERLMRRRESTPLTQGESRAFKKNRTAIESTSEEDWIALERFYAAPQQQTFARKDLASLLNNWNGEIDKAKAWMGQAPAGSPVEPIKPRIPDNLRDDYQA